MNFLIQKKGNSAIENEGYHDIILGTGDPNITWPAARNSKKHMVAAQFSSESEQSSFKLNPRELQEHMAIHQQLNNWRQNGAAVRLGVRTLAR